MKPGDRVHLIPGRAFEFLGRRRIAQRRKGRAIYGKLCYRFRELDTDDDYTLCLTPKQKTAWLHG